jgi:hexosaminidase
LINTKYNNLAEGFACFYLWRRKAIRHFIVLNLLMLLCLPCLLSAQSIDIIPLPNSFKLFEGTFHLNGNTIIGMNSDLLLPQAHYLQTELQKADGLLVAVDPNEVKALIDLQLVKHDSIPGDYSLKIEPQHVTIKAANNEGIFYGVISFLQLIRQQPPGNDLLLQGCEINDAPRYQWRGFMLDEARHFFGKEKVKQLLDWMAFYKLNKLHWHLTDASGWRIEIKKYPKLTSVGAIGNHTDSLAEAKYYTQDDIREIVAYARERFITVVPEVDMPGHATAANKAYPEFSGGITPKYPNFTFDPANENVYPFLADVLKEINGLFPGNMIHLGGDEVAYGMQAWAGRPAITEMLTKNNFTSLADLEHYFFKRMADTVIKLDDKVLCWDEATETDLPPGRTIVFWWRQNITTSLQLALQKKYQVVLCPRLPLYFDFVQDKDHLSGRKWNGSFNSESEVYNFPDKQMPAEVLKSNQILGIQANLWTETVGSEKRLDFMIYPRIAALAEAAWTDSVSKNEVSFNERLKTHFLLYDKAGIYYYNPLDPPFHPEAIDFAPRIIVPHVREKHHHGRKHGGHHHSSGGRKEGHHGRGRHRHKLRQ